MKKVILFLFFGTVLSNANAQLIDPYIQIEGGFAINQANSGLLSAEVGTTFKWFDLGFAIDHESNSFFKEYVGELNIFKDVGYDSNRNHNDEFSFFSNYSFQLVARLDIVKFFLAESKHSFKIGGGYGIIRYQKIWSTRSFSGSSDVEYNLTAKSNLGLLGSLKASYEYKINKKFSVGAYFGGTYYPSLGLLLRSNL